MSGIASFEYISTLIATLLSVITLVLTGQPLTPVNVFMLLGFMNLLRTSVCIELAYGLLGTYDAYVSLRRLEKFLLLDDLPSICSNSMENGKMDDQEEIHFVSLPDRVKNLSKPLTLIVRNLTHNQVKRKGEFILQDVKFTAELESLTVIYGPVGSGKSTLLSAIAGEVSDTSGTIDYRGTLVYVPQIAWVFSGTVRENILFGEPFDEAKYNRIIEACALTQDIRQLPSGDKTVVGERGEVLSGGQRARVSLARAIYSDADIFLLDDPLSAVDFKVGQHIFEKCIKGLLGQKTRVITSHEERHMKEADNVIVLYKGRVLGNGRLLDLKAKGVLKAAVDPVVKEMEEGKPVKIFHGENESKNEVSDSCNKTFPQDCEDKGLQISQEDRTVGVVSSKLYWDYFRSGLPFLMIFALTIWFLITQGNCFISQFMAVD